MFHVPAKRQPRSCPVSAVSHDEPDPYVWTSDLAQPVPGPGDGKNEIHERIDDQVNKHVEGDTGKKCTDALEFQKEIANLSQFNNDVGQHRNHAVKSTAKSKPLVVNGVMLFPVFFVLALKLDLLFQFRDIYDRVEIFISERPRDIKSG